MNIEQFQQRITELVDYLQNNFQRDAVLKGSIDMAAKIKRRVQETGKNSDGGYFSSYSTRTTFVGKKTFKVRPEGAWEDVMKEVKKTKALLKLQTPEERKQNLNSKIYEPYSWITTVRGHRLVILYGGYKKIKELEGYKKPFKSFTRTGLMWEKVGVREVDKTNAKILGTTDDAKNKLAYMYKQEKRNILEPNKQEIDDLNDYINAEIIKKFKETGIFK